MQDIAVLRLEGKINAMNADSIRELVNGLLENQEKKIIFDFAGVDFIDSSGLGSLVGCLRRAKAEGGDIKISSLPEKIRLVFELIRLDNLFDIYPTFEEASQNFKR